MAIPGTVTLTGPIAPTSTGDTYPVFDATYGLDGLRSVSTNAARNAIPNDRRRAGMLVGVASGSTATYWRLLSSPWTGTDSDWTIFNNGTDIFISGMTFNPANYNLSISRSDGTGFTQNLGILATDVTITGGTYDKNTGIVTFSSNTTNQRTGLYYDGNWSSLSAYTAGTVVTYAVNNLDYYVVSNGVGPNPIPPTGDTVNWRSLSGRGVFDVSGFVTGYTDSKVTGGTYNGSSITIVNSDGSSGIINGLTTLYTGDGILIGDRIVSQTGTTLTFSGTSASTFTVTQQFLQGRNVFIGGEYSHAQGNGSEANGYASHAEGYVTRANGDHSHAEGLGAVSLGSSSHAEGYGPIAYGNYSHGEGEASIAYGQNSHAEGSNTIAGGYLVYLIDFTVHNDNRFSVTGDATSNIVNTTYPFFDYNNTVVKDYTVTAVTYDNMLDITNVYLSNGDLFTANRNLTYLVDLQGAGQHAEGYYSHAIGDYSHAEGLQTNAYGGGSHTEGSNTVTYGNYSHAEGLGTVTWTDYQHASGQYNTTGNTASLFVIGNGSDDLNRSDLALFNSNLITFNTPIVIKNPDINALTSPVISFDCGATGIDQPVTINFASTNPKGLSFYASNNPITSTPDGAAFQMFNNNSVTFPGQVYFDSGAHDNAAIIWRTAPTSGTITERMRVTSDGKVGIGASSPQYNLDVIGFGKILNGLIVGNELNNYVTQGYHRVEIVASGTQTPLVVGGGSGAIEIWKNVNNPQPDAAAAFGMAVPGRALSNDFIFSAFNLPLNGWYETMRITNDNKVGIGSSAVTNTLHVSAATDPVRFEGLTATTTDTDAVTIDSNGILHKLAFSAISPTLAFTNGLTRNNNEVVLGGALTGETTLSDNRTVNATTFTPLLNIHSDRNAEFYTAQELISARKWFVGTSATTTDFRSQSNAFRIDNFLELYTGKTYNIYPSYGNPDDYAWDSGHSTIYGDLGLGAANANGNIIYSAGTNLSRTIYAFMAKLDTWPMVDSSKVVKTHKGWYAMYGAHLDAFGASGSSIDRVMYYTAGGIKWLSGTTVGDMMGMYIAPMKINDIDSQVSNLRHWNASAITNSWGIYQEGLTEKNYFGGNVGFGTTAATNQLHVSASTNPIKIEGLSSGTSNNYLLSIDDNGIVSKFPKSSISGGTSGSGTSIYWYAENTAHPTVGPIATGTSSVAFGNGAQANSSDMFVFGDSAGSGATNTKNSVFIGKNSGFNADTSSGSTFIGLNAGYLASSSEDSNFFGTNAGTNSKNISSSNFIGKSAGENSKDINYSNFIGLYAGSASTGSDNVNILGFYAGFNAADVNNSNFMGYHAGQNASGSSNSNFFGYNAGQTAFSASSSNYLGYFAGKDASYSNYSNFIGRFAGRSANNSSYSNYIGYYAGYQALSSTGNTFIGYQAGYNARYTNDSIFIGTNAGWSADPVSNLILIGYQAGKRIVDSAYIGNNNIIIGNNVSLHDNVSNSLNIGGVLFGSGLYDLVDGSPSVSAQTSGRIGIGVVASAITNTLHISGVANTLRVEGLTASTTDSNILSIDSDGVVHSYALSNLPGSPQTLQNIIDNSVVSSNITGDIHSGDEFHLYEPDTYGGLHIYGSGAAASKTVVLGMVPSIATGSVPSNGNTHGFAAVNGEQFIFGNGSSSDYSTYKPLGIGSDGKLANMNDWPSSSTFTGGTVTGPTDFTNGLTADTISATSITATTISALQYFLPPRMTESERVGLTTEVGLMVYQTDGDEGLYIYKSFGWVQII